MHILSVNMGNFHRVCDKNILSGNNKHIHITDKMMSDMIKPTFLSSHEISQLLGISRQAISRMAIMQKWQFKPWCGRGNSKIYLFESLPTKMQEKLLDAMLPCYISLNETKTEDNPCIKECPVTLADNFKRKSPKAQAKAEKCYKIMNEFIRLVDDGMPIGKAMNIVAKNYALNPANIRNWYYGTQRKVGVRNIDRKQWLFALADNYVGRKKTYAHFTGSLQHDNKNG